MKKLFSVLMVASVLSLVACKGNKPAEDTTTTVTDTTIVHEEQNVVTDSGTVHTDSVHTETSVEHK